MALHTDLPIYRTGVRLLTNIKPDDLRTWACTQTDAPPVLDAGWRLDSAEQNLGKQS